MEYNFSEKMRDLKPSAIREIFKSLSDPDVISFSGGNPSPETFPIAEIAKISAEIFARDGTEALQYNISEGYPPLRAALAARMREKIGTCEGDELIVVSGGSQGIELAAKVLCSEGDAVICEDPTFIGALNAFRTNGAKPVGVPAAGGIDPDELEAALSAHPEAKMVYLIPNFHNPMGTTMPLETRKAVYEICKRRGVVIFEDDPYGELRFSGEDVPPIKSLDSDGIVIYCSTFSKILSAGMRVGYVLAPSEITRKMVVCKQVEDVHTNTFFQMVCHRYMTEYDIDAHIRDIRAIYRRKSALMLDCLDRMMTRGVTYTRPDGGLFIWCTLPEGHTCDRVVKEALDRKVAVVPGTAFNCDETAPSPSFRLNYSMPSDEQIERGVLALSRAVESAL